MPIDRRATPPTKVLRGNKSILDQLSAWIDHYDELDTTEKKVKGNYTLLRSDGDNQVSAATGLRREWLNPDSPSWGIFIACIIVFNAGVIGLETEFGRTDLYLGLEHVFITIFLFELVLRMLNRSFFEFWTDPWNLFDFIIVVTGTMDLWLIPLFDRISGHNSLMDGIGHQATMLRLLRIVRIVRVLRLFRVVHRLHLVLMAFMKALGIVALISFFVLLLNFVLAICLTQGIGYNSHYWGEDQEKIEWYFGSMSKAMHSLFLIMTLSGWQDVADILSKVIHPGGVYVFFVAYLLITSYTMLSLITAIMSDSLVMAQNDSRRKRTNRTYNKAKDLEIELRTFLHEVHGDEKDKFGNIPAEDLKTSVKGGDPMILEKLAQIDIIMDENGIVELIDKMTDGGKIRANIDYFVNKLVNLHGSASASTVVDLKYEMEITQRKLTVLSKRLGVADKDWPATAAKEIPKPKPVLVKSNDATKPKRDRPKKTVSFESDKPGCM